MSLSVPTLPILFQGSNMHLVASPFNNLTVNRATFQQNTPLTLMHLPGEIRINIYRYVFSDMEYTIHVHKGDCLEFCGDRRRDYYNIAMLFVCRQALIECRPIFLTHGTFYIFRAAFHGRNSLPYLPKPAEIRIRNVVCWSDVAVRALTHVNEWNTLGSLVGLQMVYFKVFWNTQHQRLIHAFRNFIQQHHRYDWVIDIKKIINAGPLFRICINSLHQVLVVEHMERCTAQKIEEFLVALGLSWANVVKCWNWDEEVEILNE